MIMVRYENRQKLEIRRISPCFIEKKDVSALYQRGGYLCFIEERDIGNNLDFLYLRQKLLGDKYSEV
jgi:hypothetical protein